MNTMKIKTSDLNGRALDLAVALCEGGTGLWYDTVATWWIKIAGEDRALSKGWSQSFNPSTNWAQGGPIIERARITVSPYSHDEFNDDGVEWLAILTDPEAFVGANNYDTVFELCGQFTCRGLTPLIAAMRCYVASKLGDEVEVPDELCT